MSKTLRLPDYDQQALLDQVQVRLVERTELERFKELLDEHLLRPNLIPADSVPLPYYSRRPGPYAALQKGFWQEASPIL